MSSHTSIKRTFLIIQAVMAVLLVFLIIQGGILWKVCNQGGVATAGLKDEGLPSLQYLASLQENLAVYRLHSYELMFVQEQDRAAKLAETDAVQKKNLEIIGELNKLYPAGPGHDYVTSLQACLDDYVQTMGQIRANLDKDFAGAMKTLDQAVPGKVQKLNEAAEAVKTYCTSVASDRTTLTVSSFDHIRQAVIWLGSLSILLALISAVMVTINSTHVRRALGRLADRLSEIGESLIHSANQVSHSSQSLAEGSSEQAASLEETSSSLEEMASMTKRNSENAQKANDLARQARTAADKSVNDMQAMNAAMEAIKASSNDIAKIIKTIDEIAFQTNILALNAAVEAARAGEAGMGFAVVADEVRNLAQRSAQAAKETATKIEGAIGKTAQGVKLSSQVAATLNDMVTQIRQVDELAAEVAGASHEQTQGITQINSAVGQMDKVTQSNAASAEESAAAAQELNAQAAAMQDSVSQLLTLVGGNHYAGSYAGGDDNNDQAPRQPVLPPPAHRRNGHDNALPSHSRNVTITGSSAQGNGHIPMPPMNGGADIPMPAPVANGKMTWDETTMATGVESVDSQHKTLIEHINNLHNACLAGTARSELMNMLSFLGNYAQTHFKHEEEIMQAHKCPARGKNKAAHVQFLRDYESLFETVKRDGASTTAVIQLKEMLSTWLKNHICNVDTHLRECSQAHSA